MIADIGSVGKGWKSDLGANPEGRGVFFRVWASKADSVSVRIVSGNYITETRLQKRDNGYFADVVESAEPGDRYFYVLDGREHYPDPASRYQPEGVHGASEIIDPDQFRWTDEGWKSPPLEDFVIYEMHIGTFTREGTFESALVHLDYLVRLGVTAIELMPVTQFSGRRNWGYDGVYPFAPQNSYGGPNGLKKLINAAHRKGLSVILDVVYNHLGPEGNYLGRYSAYFTERYKTPWGDAVNFDGPLSEGVRHFFISNALHWIHEYHIDALRLDAVHAICDFSPRHFLDELRSRISAVAQKTGRSAYLIAESDLNESKLVVPSKKGGYGLDAVWNEDFHHALHALITGEEKGYYKDFGKLGHLRKALAKGFVYTGQYSVFRKRRHGKNSQNIPTNRFIVFSQSHDQVGNRLWGDRLSLELPLEKLKLVAGVVLLSPYIPLLFMGEEYGETAPFQYFTNFADEALAAAVRRGRREEMYSLGWKADVPDPQAEKTFLSSKLSIGLRLRGKQKTLLDLYGTLITLRKEVPALSKLSRERMRLRCLEKKKALIVRRWSKDDEVCILYNFGEGILKTELKLTYGKWSKLLESSSGPREGARDIAEERMIARGKRTTIRLQPHSFVLYRRATRNA